MRKHSRFARLAVATLLAGIFPAVAVAQQAVTVSGRVTEGPRNEPVSRATVSIPEFRFGAQTGLDGRYSFTLQEPLTHGELRPLRDPNDPAEQVFELTAASA